MYTASDLCRRFDVVAIEALQTAINATRVRVWRQQPDAFFAEVFLDADGTLAETTGRARTAWTSPTWGVATIRWSYRW